MKRLTAMTIIALFCLSAMTLAKDINAGALDSQFNSNENEPGLMNGRDKLQIGRNKNKNDGVEFIVDEKKLEKLPKELHKDSKVKLEIAVLNTTDEDAYLYGWIDYNNDGAFEESELIIDKKIKSSDKNKLKTVKGNFKVPTIALVGSDLIEAYFELSTVENQVTPQSAGQNGSDSHNRKYGDLMLQTDNRYTVETRAAMGDYETYPIQLLAENPVAVTLSSFNAIQMAEGVKLEWKVEQEINHAGYNVYRSDNEETGYNKINDSIILAWDGFSAFDGTYEYTDNVNGAYFYKLEAIDVDGSSEMFGPYSVQSSTGVADKLDMPESFELKQNYPNPFNPTTTISFSLAERTNVNITIFDLTGRIVSTLVDESMDAGAHNVVWNAVNNFGESLATGVYFYTMRTANFTATKALTIMK